MFKVNHDLIEARPDSSALANIAEMPVSPPWQATCVTTRDLAASTDEKARTLQQRPGEGQVLSL